MTWLWPIAGSADEADWNDLYARELPRIYNFFRYRVGDRATAEDLTAATFEKAWRARDRYRRDLAKFSTWLFSIARNVAIDHMRRRRDEVPLDEAAERSAPDSPEEQLIRKAELERLRRLCEDLPERDRELLALKYGAGLSNREIARVYGLTESNVGTILHRAVQQLRAKW